MCMYVYVILFVKVWESASLYIYIYIMKTIPKHLGMKN